ncbi:hypothetical protein LX36DRAFT_91390 [Colletotrichum falcatum]|nr:hypothetical protein LX36DRAFT_91390 [Colletotrichum falcatum]
MPGAGDGGGGRGCRLAGPGLLAADIASCAKPYRVGAAPLETPPTAISAPSAEGLAFDPAGSSTAPIAPGSWPSRVDAVGHIMRRRKISQANLGSEREGRLCLRIIPWGKTSYKHSSRPSDCLAGQRNMLTRDCGSVIRTMNSADRFNRTLLD